jgi:hypothetical protein
MSSKVPEWFPNIEFLALPIPNLTFHYLPSLFLTSPQLSIV